jgi:hypothetical protein
MRHPPSPLLLSARKRRPRRNPPRGAQLGSPTPGEQRAEADMQQQQQAQAAEPDEKCALLTPGPEQDDGPREANDEDPEQSQPTQGRSRQR